MYYSAKWQVLEEQVSTPRWAFGAASLSWGLRYRLTTWSCATGSG